MRTHTVFGLLAVACGLLVGTPARAQSAPAPTPGAPNAATAAAAREAPARDRSNQRIEHIQHEDAGSRVDELRVGGETQSITVQPKAAMPPYEVQPADPSGVGVGSRESGPGSAGRRVWKLREF